MSGELTVKGGLDACQEGPRQWRTLSSMSASPTDGDPPSARSGLSPPFGPERALGELADAFDRAVQAIGHHADSQQAFEAATRLTELLRKAVEEAAELRARAAVRIWEEKKISLAGLAERIGVSKARAGQLVQSARRAQQSRTNKAKGRSDE